MPAILSPERRAETLPALGEAGWSATPDGDGIRKVWRFRGFPAAWAFMTKGALAAEKAGHHPDWRNSYDIVDVTLTTHSAGGLTELDLSLAAALDLAAGDAEIVRDLARPILSLCAIRAAEDGA